MLCVTGLQPPDKFFKEAFTRHEAARDFLRYYLPPELSQLFDLDTLEISKDSFIDPNLQEHFSDVLYQLRLITADPLQIYVLFEHKSYSDKKLPFQLLRYMGRIWEQQEKQGETPFLPILPVVVYHGPKAWTGSLHFSGLFAENLPLPLKPYLPDFRYELLDLSSYPDEKIKGWVILQAHLLLLKYVWRQDFGEQFRRAVRLLVELTHQETALEYLATMLRYAVAAAEHVSETELQTIVIELLEEGEPLMATIAESWVQQGIIIGQQKGIEIGQQKGIEIGQQKGIEIGQQKGIEIGRKREREETQRRTWELLFKTIRQTLVIRFQIPLDQFDSRLQQLELVALEKLNECVFEAPSLAAFEAELQLLEQP